MTPESVGIPRNKLILGKHSGRHAFRERLNVLGVPLDDVELDRAFKAFKDLADRKKNVYDEDILSLVETQEEKTRDKYIFKSSKVVSESTKLASASVVVEKNGQEMFDTEMGAGPVDAVYKAIKNLTHFEGTLERYGVNAITGGTDAQGEVFVTISDNKKTTRGSGAHTDIIVASAMAFLQAINRMGEATSRKSPQGI